MRSLIIGALGAVFAFTACGSSTEQISSADDSVETQIATTRSTQPSEPAGTTNRPTTTSVSTTSVAPTTTLVTPSGLHCGEMMASAVYDYGTGTTGFDTPAAAIEDYWRERGGVGNYEGATLRPAPDNDGATFRYVDDRGIPVLLVSVTDEYGNGWLVSGTENCWPLVDLPEFDPATAVETTSGLRCGPGWFDGTNEPAPDAAGELSIESAHRRWWEATGEDLRWTTANLDVRWDTDGVGARYHTAEGRPVVFLRAAQLASGGWYVQYFEACSER